jgi:transposase InsO family protein
LKWYRYHPEERDFPMAALYRVAGISKQGFYKSLKGEEKKTRIMFKVEDKVKTIRKDHPRLGSRPLYHKLRIKEVGINKFEKLVQESGLGIKQKKKRIITTISNPNHLQYPNLTYGLKLNDINQLWSSDITYWLGEDDTYYIILLQDVYSRRILGSHADDNMYADNNLKVLDQSMQLRGIHDYQEQLIHHSDKGSQYTSNEYLGSLYKAGIKISMARNSIENPYSERLNGIIKNDYLAYENIYNLSSLREALKRAVWLYDNERPHSELNYMTPVEFEKALAITEPEKRKAMILYDFSDKPKLLTGQLKFINYGQPIS